MFLAGWNDGTTGPSVGFGVVSLIFVVGFMSGALVNISLTDRLGYGKVIVPGDWKQFTPGFKFTELPQKQAAALPFPVFVFSFVVNGIGRAMQDTQATGFVASLKDHSAAKTGMLSAAYGTGALVLTLVSTQFAQAERWLFYYLVSLCIAFSNTIFLIAVFGL
ncbi:hypothetical protein PILCRDRAFT_14375 [Piloderma croceum F 1598]|uniref:Major facilitator superfamily (MFS) profile domain-containing protein n=1 Tax=Piloderma croceum (strain F 1598) TaxID=765440 RepID=A0A0C3AKM7_PILCF|nr:hypothetical protein PILCRDRAFT_14375 [Piloderma croceum F 1598]